MIKIEFVKKTLAADILDGLVRGVKMMDENETRRVSFTGNRIMLWRHGDKTAYEECRYEIGPEGAVFMICEGYKELVRLIMFYMTQSIGKEAFITTEESRIFYGGDFFYLVKNGKVHKMKDGFEKRVLHGYETVCEIEPISVRRDMWEFVKKSRIEADD